MNYLIIGGAILLVIGWVCFAVFEALYRGASSASKALAAQRQQRLERNEHEKSAALAAAERQRIEAYRNEHPVRMVGVPNPEAFRRAFALLDEFTAAANAYRPQLPAGVDTQFRAYNFPVNMFDLVRPHPATLSHTEPRKITLTSADIQMDGVSDMSAVYGRAAVDCAFPCEPPSFRYAATEAPAPKPAFPRLTAPPKSTVRLLMSDGVEVDGSDELAASAFNYELHRLAALNSQAAQLHAMFDERYEAALEARDLMEIYLADLGLKWRNAETELLQEFEQQKRKYEADCDRATHPIRAVHQRYRERTEDGIRGHFELALCSLSLPVPSDYPWGVLYNQQERVLQVNQCVPSLADVTVARPDSKRPPAKRDAEAVLRRYVPAIALQVAQNIARNDLQGDVERIAVNCWSRFFDPASGKLKDAFVASLAVQKKA